MSDVMDGHCQSSSQCSVLNQPIMPSHLHPRDSATSWTHLGSSLLLGLVVVIDPRSVLGAPVVALLVQGGGVHLIEELLQKLLIGDLRGVEVHLCHPQLT